MAVYTLWDDMRQHIATRSRFTLGAKIDMFFLDVIERLFVAGSLPRGQKLTTLQHASAKLDLLKFFLQISWETHIINTQKYAALSQPLEEIGKMLGGWLKNVEKETPVTRR